MTRLLSNLLKSNWVVFREDDARVINSGERLDQKLSELQRERELAEEPEEVIAEENEFTDGIEAGQVDALLSEDGAEAFLENAGEGETNPIIKAEPVQVQQGPTPEELLEEAQQQVNVMLEQAQQEAEEIKRNAYEAGHQEGYDAASAELQQRAEEQENQYREREKQLAQHYLEKQEELEPMFVDLITNIYEHVFHIDLSDFREIIIYSIVHVVGAADGKKDFIVRVSSADYSFVSERRAQIMQIISDTATLELVEDVTLAQGECMVETGGGIFDCGIDTQLKSLNKELRLLSYEKQK